MSDIEDEAYTEAMEEIERLKARIERLSRDNAFYGSNDYVHSLKVLLVRAADALEDWKTDPSVWKFQGEARKRQALIAELRKAAE